MVQSAGAVDEVEQAGSLGAERAAVGHSSASQRSDPVHDVEPLDALDVTQFAVTSTALSDSACAAIISSKSPIGVSARCN